MTIGKLNVLLGLNNAQFSAGLQRSGSQVRTFRSTVTSSTTTLSSLAGMASKATIAIGILYSTMAAVRPVEAFNQAMASSTAIMGDVSGEMRASLVKTAQDVAMATKFNATETAGAYYYLISAGMDAQQSMAALPQVAKFAQAGMFDLSLATDLATDAQSALGLVVKDPIRNLENLTRVTDVLVKANTLANASTQQFSAALTNKSGAAIRALGKDIEEGVAVLAAFADQGVKGEEAGTQFAIVLRDLQTKAIENAAAFEANRVKVFDSAGEMRHMADIMSDLETRLGGMSDKLQKATLLQMGFSDKSLSALQTLLGTSEKIRDYEAGLRDAAGTTAEVAGKQMPTFTKGVGELKDAFLELMGAIGTPWLENLGVGLRLIAYPLRAFAQWLQEAYQKYLQFTGIGKLAGWLNTMVSDYSTMQEEANKANGAMTDGAAEASTAVGSLNDAIGDTSEALTMAASAADEFISKLNADVRFRGVDSRVRELAEMMESGGFRDANNKLDLGKFIEANNAAMNSAIYEAKEKILDQGRALTESVMTPQEKLNARIADANRLLNLGAIGWQTYTREIAAARQELVSLQAQLKGPSLVERGSQADFESLDRWRAMQEGLRGLPAVPMPRMGAGPASLRRPPVEQGEMIPITRVTPTPAKDREDQTVSLETLKRIEKRLESLLAETSRTTNAANRTAAAAERIQLPEVVEM